MSKKEERNKVVCRNCDNSIEANYCSVCGQSLRRGQRLNSSYLLHEIQHGILHVDKGILYTLKELLLHPAKTINSYIQGKRVRFFQPFPFVVILATVYAFLTYFIPAYTPVWVLDESQRELTESLNNISMTWVYGHYSIAMLFLIPFSAFSSFLFFRKEKYNYVEHLVIYSYITGMQIIIQIFFLFLSYLFSPQFIYYSVLFAIVVYNIWVLCKIFTHSSPFVRFIKALLSIGFGFMLGILAISVILGSLILFGIIDVL